MKPFDGGAVDAQLPCARKDVGLHASPTSQGPHLAAQSRIETRLPVRAASYWTSSTSRPVK
jgi:hypothetical protein